MKSRRQEEGTRSCLEPLKWAPREAPSPGRREPKRTGLLKEGPQVSIRIKGKDPREGGKMRERGRGRDR